MSKTVAIIGGGPSGFAAARALLHEPAKFKINIYERQTKPGGVWVYTGKGPMYDDLDTNIYKQLMEYENRPFAESLPLYPNRKDVWDYVDVYSREIGKHDAVKVYWGTTVSRLTKESSQWQLALAHDEGGLVSSSVADYVVIATGHYSHPFYPEIPGLAEYAESSPNSITHTRHYVRPDPYRNKKVLVVGNGSSGVDITIQLLSVTSPITVSRRHEAKPDKIFEENQDVVWKPEPIEIAQDGAVTFKDNSTDKFDVIMFATGYLYKMPFLEKTGKAGDDLVDPAGLRVRNIYKFIFYIEDPSLAFVALNKQVVPMPLSESQAAVIARVWSGRLTLPSTQEMHKDEQKVIDAKGDGTGYFQMGYPVDVEYMHYLNDWADRAGAGGFNAERWGPDKEKMRSEIADRKLLEYARKKKEAVEHRLHS